MPAKKVAQNKRRVAITITLPPSLVRTLRQLAKAHDEPVSRLVERHLSKLRFIRGVVR